MADLNKTRYTHRDYASLKQDLINAIPSLTQEWTSREDADPGIVLIKLMAMFGDHLSYNMDKMALELYLDTVTQRKNCAKILRLLGYKMHWYRSARLTAHVRLESETDQQGNPIHIILVPFETKFKGGDKYYSVVPQYVGSGDIDIASAERTTAVSLVEGTAKTVRFNRESLTENRFYFPDRNVDESAIWLTFGKHVCNLVDNLYLVTDDQSVSFEFNVDEFDNPYIELVDYWADIIGSSAQTGEFTLNYIVSSGSQGSVSQDQLTTVVGYKTDSSSSGKGTLVVTHLGNNSSFVQTDSGNTPGMDPQTVEDAKDDAADYVFTHDTFVTVEDYEKAARRVDKITAAKIIDNQVIEDLGLNIDDIVNRAKDFIEETNGMTQEVGTEENPETWLKPYIVILYAGYDDLSASSNMYTSLPADDAFRFDNYDNEPSDSIKALGYYPYKPLNYILVKLDDIYKNGKMMNTEVYHGTTKVYPFKVAGTIHLTEPLSPDETLTVVNAVDNKLREKFYPENHTYGTKPNFMEVVETVQGADTHLKYFDVIDNLIEYPSFCDFTKFDATSFTLYNGLSDNFNVDSRFMSFRIKNISTSNAEIRLNATKTVTVPALGYLTIKVDSVAELRSLCNSLAANPYLSYAS